MKLSWIEDFLTLCGSGTFSKAAQRRNVTQPAFSRRIQMLENWLGVQLIDRRTHRCELTATAARFEPELRRLASTIYELRSHMRADSVSQSSIALTAQHTLMVTHLPKLLRFLQNRHQETTFRVRTGNLDECVAQLTRAEADLLLCFEVNGESPPEWGVELERVKIGNERLLPVTARTANGQPLFDPDYVDSIKLLNYPEESFLGQVVRRQCLPDLVRRYTTETVCESAFTVGIKEMAMAGMGIAWLPHGLVQRDLDAGDLFSLHEKLGSPLLTVTIYRVSGSRLPALDQIWSILERETLEL